MLLGDVVDAGVLQLLGIVAPEMAGGDAFRCHQVAGEIEQERRMTSDHDLMREHGSGCHLGNLLPGLERSRSRIKASRRRTNSSEKRLARILLLLAQFDKEGVPETVTPQISQETLAEMIGTTRSRVSFFMNRFRKLGFVDYGESGLQVHSSLLNIVLHD